MTTSRVRSVVLLCASACFAHAQARQSGVLAVAPQTTIPVVFTRSVSANEVKPGTPVLAKTMQEVWLANGQEVRQGALVLAHVVSAAPFHFNKTPYAKQAEASLAIQFDSLVVSGEKVPLHVYVRALADPFATDAAVRPRPTDEDPLSSTTQVGGDIRTPSQREIVSQDGDTVGYSRRGGNFAHLLANGSAGSAGCDGTNTEQAVAIFSASACGLYGFTELSLNSTGNVTSEPQFALTSTRRAPEIVRYSSALLEEVSEANTTSASR